ncbi:hypothetical protein ACFVEN_33085 [Streptomyces sp. NPDC057681]|uniref:hypothetical protein n=1 Tax=Streptomyces sp. NPDC057681 TaxID=3346209 RepID=UPI0036BFC701
MARPRIVIVGAGFAGPLDAVLPRQAVQLGLVRSRSVPLDTASPEPARAAGGADQRDSPPEGAT